MRSHSTKLITQSSLFLPNLSNTVAVQGRMSFNIAPRPSSSLKKPSIFLNKSQQKVYKQRIRDQNIRMITAIAQIKQRRPRIKTQSSRILHKQQSYQRKREIKLQNERLGKSIMKIKLRKTLERTKTERSPDEKKLKSRKQRKKIQRYMLTDQYNLYQMQGEVQHYEGSHKNIAKLTCQESIEQIQQ